MRKINLKLFTLLMINLVVSPKSFSQSITAGGYYSHTLCNDGSRMSWGYNLDGELGDGTFSNRAVPVQINSIIGITDISGGLGYHSLALRNDGIVFSWGANFNGELGNGISGPGITSNIPVQVSTLTNVIAVSAGNNHSVALKSDGTVWTWGTNTEGELGDGTNSNSNIPIQISSLTNIIAIAAGGFHTLALKSDSTVWAWGFNFNGALGNGTNIDSNIPVQVLSASSVISVKAGRYHSMALKADGTVLTWGQNGWGELGDGTFVNSPTPIQVPSLSNIKKISTAGLHCLALKNDSTVMAWGLNAYGELGNGSTSSSGVPVPVNALTRVIEISGGGWHSLAKKDDGTIWAWGYNFNYQLGIADTINRDTPIQVNGLCSTSNISEYQNTVSALIFPNPITHFATIKFDSFINNATITISNVLGENIKTFNDICGDSFDFQRDNLSQGVYFIRVTEREKLISTNKIIVSK
ncbi:T9SS type A sorting domain-containing protein [soil metagenome]